MVIPIAFVALAGVASATLTVNVDTIQTNGHYVGIPTIINGETYQYRYNYNCFVPDGSYIVYGSIASDDANNSTPARLILCYYHREGHRYTLTAIGPKEHEIIPSIASNVTVPANGKADFSFTWNGGLPQDDPNAETGFGYALVYFPDVPNSRASNILFNPSLYVNQSDTTAHTVDEGPMSGMSAIFNNGVLSSNATIIYSLNVTSDDYKALYTNGRMDFKGSPLYAFAE